MSSRQKFLLFSLTNRTINSYSRGEASVASNANKESIMQIASLGDNGEGNLFEFSLNAKFCFSFTVDKEHDKCALVWRDHHDNQILYIFTILATDQQKVDMCNVDAFKTAVGTCIFQEEFKKSPVSDKDKEIVAGYCTFVILVLLCFTLTSTHLQLIETAFQFGQLFVSP